MSATPPDGSRPSRKLKVRTGCITCKIRKVKCDENKPSCKRCTDTGRKCDGYAAIEKKPRKEDATRSAVAIQPRPSPPLSGPRVVRRIAPAAPNIDVSFLSQPISGEERKWIEFFSLRTGPALSSVFSHSFWSYTLPQLSISEPAIRHSLLALGSAHARFEAAASNNQVVAEAISLGFVLRHYNGAIKHLQQHLSNDSNKIDVPLLCCLLFISLECLNGNRPLVLDHLRNGLNILKSAQARDANDEASSNSFTPSIRRQVRPLFHRLEAQSTLLGQPASPLFGDIETISSLTTPTHFVDFEHAKTCLDTLVSSTLLFVRNIHDQSWKQGVCPRLARPVQKALQAQFVIWSSSMADLVQSCKSFTADDEKREKSLRVQHIAAFVWVSRCTELHETSYDCFTNEFRSIVQWARVLATPSTDSTQDPSLAARLASLSINGSAKFTLNMAYIPPLYLVAINCRNPIIRREAVSILEETHGREGLWDAHLHAQVARRIIEIEESSTLMFEGATQVFMESGPLMRMVVDGEYKTLSSLPDERFRVHDAEIRDVSEGWRGTCNVTFYTAPHGLLEEWVLWKEVIHF